MSEALAELARRHGLRLPEELFLMTEALPDGADLGTVRLLSPAEIASARWRGSLSPALLPIAEEGSLDLFALQVPPEPGAAVRVVCAVALETGVYAPLASSIRGLAAYLLLLRRAQALLGPSGPLEDTREAAERLAGAFGLEKLLGEEVEPDSAAIARALLAHDPASPWALSLLAREEASPAQALRRLGPALLSAAFSAGLLDQAAQALIAAGDLGRACRALVAALRRLEPGLQAAPYKLDQPDEQDGAPLAPFDPAAAWRFLAQHPAQLPAELRGSAMQALMERAVDRSPGTPLRLDAAETIDFARRRTLSGDAEAGRWALSLALGAVGGDRAAKRALAEELERAWSLAGSSWYASGFHAIASSAS